MSFSNDGQTAGDGAQAPQPATPTYNGQDTPNPGDVAQQGSPAQTRTVEEDYYCPACGAKFDYRQKCDGTSATGFGHAPIEVVSTDEIQNLDLPANERQDTPEQSRQREALTPAPASPNA
jgi:protein-disulfide isomerase